MGFAGAEGGIRLVHHDCYRPDRVEQAQDPLQVGLGLPLPLGAEVQELDDRNADLLREAADDEALPRAHGAAHEIAHRYDVEPALGERAGSFSEQRLRALMPRHRVEVDIARHERKQAAARLLD